MQPFLHCWQADLQADYPTWPAAEATLSGAERARQARLHTPTLRQTYGRAHGFLREVLSNYTRLAASLLTFDADPLGKPTLAAGHDLHFNLSYRPGRALVAISNAGPVGADVEALQALPDVEALVAQFFAASEQAALRAADATDWWPLFYTIWTRKEAYAKALGMGLGMPFAAFSVIDALPIGPPVLTAPAGASLHSFGVCDGYLGSVASIDSKTSTVHHFTYGISLPLSLS